MINLDALVSAVQKSSLSAYNLLKKKNEEIFNEYFESVRDESKNGKSILKAKTVTIEYPRETAQGIVPHHVEVPLITLMPISQTQIEEIDFELDLEIYLKNDELRVAFPKSRKDNLKSNENDTTKVFKESSIAKLKIKMTKEIASDGLQKIVEGYEKVLRAQIPG